MSAVATLSLSAALVAGFASSGHCSMMCGGIAGALGMRARSNVNAKHAASAALLYQTGRVGGYALLGALCGAFGATLQLAVDVSKLIGVLRVASGVLLILLSLRFLLRLNLLGILERAGFTVWRRLQPTIQKLSASRSFVSELLLGLLWGWLPCGLVYSMLLFAAMSGGPLTGAAVMIAFGLGTLPAMLTGTLLASQAQRFFLRPWARPLSGVLLLLLGVWIVVAGLQTHQHHHEHSASMGSVNESWPKAPAAAASQRCADRNRFASDVPRMPTTL